VRFGISNGAWYGAVQRGAIVLRETARAPRTGTREAVASLLAQGLSQAAIARELGISKPTVCFHVRKLGIAASEAPAQRYDWDAIRAYYEAGHSAAECRSRFGFGRDAWAGSHRPRRDPSEAEA
jgi:Bacterial regulatory proteins, luxR family